jgi:hypothetical protein
MRQALHIRIICGCAAFVAALCVAPTPSQAADPAAHTLEAPPQSADSGHCPAKTANGAGIVEMTLMFSVSNPKQDVACRYSDGSGASFQVDQGCDVEPTGIILDGMPSGGAAFTFGQHQCHESSPGAGECHIVCRKR